MDSGNRLPISQLSRTHQIVDDWRGVWKYNIADAVRPRIYDLDNLACALVSIDFCLLVATENASRFKLFDLRCALYSQDAVSRTITCGQQPVSSFD